MYLLRCIGLFITLIFSFRLAAQPVPLPAINTRNVSLNQSANRIYSSTLDPFYAKLVNLQKEKTGVVRIVQIGDSHIQADFLSAVVRNGLQKTFGDAGRGLVFPYQVARSNAPSDIKSYSNTGWRANRLAHPEIPLDCGISGFCIQSTRPAANVQLVLQPFADGTLSTFKHLKLFTDSASSWLLRTDSNNISQLKHNETDSNKLWYDVLLPSPVTGFTITTDPSQSPQYFYGALLETDLPGVIYNSIGVNGARYDHYNSSKIFWQQLPALEADLYIISMGTNEAQAASFDAVTFERNVRSFISNIRAVSPSASILITTAVDSYKSGRPNKVLQQLNNFLASYTAANNIALWDVYRVTLGYNASRNWIRRGLMAKDRVHYTKEGYQLQGALLLDVLLKSYNQYYTSRQN